MSSYTEEIGNPRHGTTAGSSGHDVDNSLFDIHLTIDLKLTSNLFA